MPSVNRTGVLLLYKRVLYSRNARYARHRWRINAASDGAIRPD